MLALSVKNQVLAKVLGFLAWVWRVDPENFTSCKLLWTLVFLPFALVVRAERKAIRFFLIVVTSLAIIFVPFFSTDGMEIIQDTWETPQFYGITTMLSLWILLFMAVFYVFSCLVHRGEREQTGTEEEVEQTEQPFLGVSWQTKRGKAVILVVSPLLLLFFTVMIFVAAVYFSPVFLGKVVYGIIQRRVSFSLAPLIIFLGQAKDMVHGRTCIRLRW